MLPVTKTFQSGHHRPTPGPITKINRDERVGLRDGPPQATPGPSTGVNRGERIGLRDEPPKANLNKLYFFNTPGIILLFLYNLMHNVTGLLKVTMTLTLSTSEYRTFQYRIHLKSRLFKVRLSKGNCHYYISAVFTWPQPHKYWTNQNI